MSTGRWWNNAACQPWRTSRRMPEAPASRWRRSGSGNDLVLTNVAAVAAFQSAKHGHRQDGESSKHQQGLVDATNQLIGIGSDAIGNEKRGGPARGRNAEAE